MKRPPTPPHTWRQVAKVATVRPLVLEPARGPTDIDTSWLADLPVTGDLRHCLRCGCMVLYGGFVDGHGDVIGITLYGVDLDSMSPVRRPTCEVLCRPGTLDEDDSAVQLRLRGVA